MIGKLSPGHINTAIGTLHHCYTNEFAPSMLLGFAFLPVDNWFGSVGCHGGSLAFSLWLSTVCQMQPGNNC